MAAGRSGEPALLSVPWRPASAGPVASRPLAKPPDFLSLSDAWVPRRGTSRLVGRLGPPHSDASTFDRAVGLASSSGALPGPCPHLSRRPSATFPAPASSPRR